MIDVTIELRGLIGLVSHRTDSPPGATLLFPNATQPSATWIPEVLRFSTPHRPRVVLLGGSRVASDSDVQAVQLQRCKDDGSGMETVTGVELLNQHLTLGTSLGPYSEDRQPGGDPNQGASATTLNHGPTMEDLASLADPPLGGVSADLTSPSYQGNPQRIISRMEIGSGSLSGELWRRNNEYPRLWFIEKRVPSPGEYTPYEDHLLRTHLLRGQVADRLTLHLRDLADENGTRRSLIVEGGSQGIHLLIENGDTACDPADYDFVAQYLLRDGWDRLTAVRVPDVGAWSNDGSGSNPQCSPTDHGG